MKRIFTFFVLAFLVTAVNNSQAQSVYASLKSGQWTAGDVWETFSDLPAAIAGAVGSGTASALNPTAADFVYIRPGHTMGMSDANRSIRGIYIASGGKLTGVGNTSDRRLQIGAAITGALVYPQSDSIWVDGALGGASEFIYVESAAAAQTIRMFGTGTVDIKRIRMPGGSGAGVGGVLNFNVEMNINLWQAAGYAVSAVFNPSPSDNYGFNIQAGKTVFIKVPAATFFNNQTTSTIVGYGNYTYNINGTLDASASTVTTTIFAPAAYSNNPSFLPSSITLNIDGGTLKLGTGFKADTTKTAFTSVGLLDFKIINGGVLDATATTSFNVNKTTDNAGGVKDLVFVTDGTGTIKRTVINADAKFPFGVGTSNNTAILLNNGTSDVYTASVKGTIDNAAPDATKVVNRQWTITKTTPAATANEISLTWVTADQAASFTPGADVNILRWTGSAYEAHPATVTGAGTAASPYVAKATGFTAFSPFIIANLGVLPIYFEGYHAFQKGTGVQVEWKVARQSNSDVYYVEKSADGRSFTIGTTITVARGSNQLDFSWFDANPFTGNNYYRIRSKDDAGEIKYTPVMRVNLGRGATSIVISPNPVENNILNLQMSNLSAGNYVMNLFNTAGQAVYTTVIRNEGGAMSESIKLPSTVSAGIYTLQLTNGVMKEKRMILVK